MIGIPERVAEIKAKCQPPHALARHPTRRDPFPRRGRRATAATGCPGGGALGPARSPQAEPSRSALQCPRLSKSINALRSRCRMSTDMYRRRGHTVRATSRNSAPGSRPRGLWQARGRRGEGANAPTWDGLRQQWLLEAKYTAAFALPTPKLPTNLSTHSSSNWAMDSMIVNLCIQVVSISTPATSRRRLEAQQTQALADLLASDPKAGACIRNALTCARGLRFCTTTV